MRYSFVPIAPARAARPQFELSGDTAQLKMCTGVETRKASRRDAVREGKKSSGRRAATLEISSSDPVAVSVSDVNKCRTPGSDDAEKEEGRCPVLPAPSITQRFRE